MMIMAMTLLTAGSCRAAGFPVDITLSPDSGVIYKGNNTKTLTATVTRKSDNTAVASFDVSFSTSLGTIDTTTAKTDANGKANVTLTAGETPGTATITASATYKANAATGTSAGTATDTATIYIVKVEMDNPTGDPVNAPEQDRNEFTFGKETRGICRILCRAKLTPDNEATQSWAKKNVEWSISDLPATTTTKEWVDADGAQTDNKGSNVICRFIGLPRSYTDFGAKTVTMKAFGTPTIQPIEIFFSKYDTNHPGGNQPLNPTERTPNWFYYWNQAVGDSNAVYVTAGNLITAMVPAMQKWSPDMTYTKTEIWVNNGCAEAWTGRLGRSPRVTGIDTFANIIRHEKEHVSQIARADALLTQRIGKWEKGWAWNVARTDESWNHYNPGPPPENLDISDQIDVNVPDAWEPLDIERAAEAQETIPEDTNWQIDWGDEGKKHQTKAYDD